MSTKILAITGIRSDYDLLSDLYQRIHKDPEMELGLIVCGAHLAKSYGNTVEWIEKDRLPILARIESLLDSNSPAARVKSAAISLQGCVQVVDSFQPDVILYQGDREEVIVGALLGAYMKVPTIHFFGGDHAPDGNVDNAVRHAASQLSSLHFVAHERHRERLIRMGERENRIFFVGSPQLDKFLTIPWKEKKALLKELHRPSWGDYALMIQHPLHGQEEKAARHYEETLQALREERIRAFVIYPNSDPGSRSIISVIEKYQQDENFCSFKNIDRQLFVNLMRHALFLIGNSSAGLFEAPMVPLGVVNVGDRQRGRLAAENVVFVDNGVPSIKKGIQTVSESAFQTRLKGVKSPYGDGKSVERAYQLLKTLKLSDYAYKFEDPLRS